MTDFRLLTIICCFGSADYRIGYIGKPIIGISADMPIKGHPADYCIGRYDKNPISVEH